MDKYCVKFCECGRVHFIEWNLLNEACYKDNKSALVVCSNCGKSYLKWLSDCMEGKAWNSITIRDRVLDEKDEVEKIIISSGDRIWMKTGKEACAKAGNTFIDWETPESEATYEERTTVDIEKTIRMIDNDEKLRELSHYAVDINWKGTKYENIYNSK